MLNVNGVETLLENLVKVLYVNQNDEDYSVLNSNDFTTTFKSLYEHYASIYGTNTSNEDVVEPSGSKKSSLFNIFSQSRKKTKHSSALDELTIYQQTPLTMYIGSEEEFNNFNILE